MPNILLDGSQWMGWNNDVPAPEWNGATYDFLGSMVDGKYYGGDTLTYTGTVEAGDICKGSITSTSADNTEFAVLVNGTVVASQTLVNGVAFPFDTGALPADANVTIQLGVGDYLYSQDAVLTPTPDPLPVVAPNQAIVCTQGSADNTVTPIIRQGGTPVTPDSLVIDQAPTHGTASVSGANLVYTPDAEFIGDETFTYHAVVGGVASNTATVYVTVNAPCDGPLLEVWPPPDQVYPLRIRAYAVQKPFGYTVAPATEPDDNAMTSCDSRLVFLLALAKAKAHYEHPDANVYANQFNAMLDCLRAGDHGTRRYVPHEEVRDELRHREDPDPSTHWIKS